MNTYYIVKQDELYHHGILGQKWGVRRFQNEDGSLTDAGKKRYGINSSGHFSTEKGARKYYKDNKNEMLNRHTRYEEDYDSTKEGTKLRTNYENAISDMEKRGDKYKKADWDKFNQAEEEYLKSQASYAAKKMIEHYGEEKANLYAFRGSINKGKSAYERMVNDWRVHAY